jgi:hypothetical protein
VLTPWPNVSQKNPGELNRLQGVRGDLPPEPALPPQVSACLGERLRAHYAQLMKEPVPDNMLRILEALDQSGRGGDDH